jgi:diacylglycerol kinase family enzyme
MRILVVRGRARRAMKKPYAEFLRRVRHGGWHVDEIAFADFLASPPAPAGFDDLAVFGGDGTVNACLTRTGALPIVVAPAGSGNDLARALGVDSISDASRLLRCGHRDRIDIGRARHDSGEELFANGIGIGLDGVVSALHRHGLSYTTAAAAAMARPLRFRATVTLDDRTPFDAEFLSLAIANGPFSGGGYLTSPAAKLDDGWIDLTMIEPVSRWKFLKSLPAAKRGDHVTDSSVRTMRARRVIIESETPFPWHLDGEPRASRKLEISLDRRARQFYTPLKN